MNSDLVWVTSKIKQLLEQSPYVFDYTDYCYGQHPSLIYKKFIITVESEDSITLGIQPMMMEKEEQERLINKMRRLVDNVYIKEL